MGGRSLRRSTEEIRGLRRSIYMQPKVRKFSASNGGADLLDYLRFLDNHTSLQPINDATDLQLSSDGGTRRGDYRFTSAAFRQIAQIIAPGLSTLLPEISGTINLPESRRLMVDAGRAIQFWNDMVSLRFPLFERYRIIRNDRERTIEGLVGNKHRYLENLALYQEACDTLDNYAPGVTVYAAILVGRRFSVWFRASQPMFSKTIDGETWPFYHGFYFTNGEATGTSVRGTMAMFTPKGVCLGPYRQYGRRVTHTGRDFIRKLGASLADICQVEIPIEILNTGTDRLLSTGLGFVADSSKESRAQRRKKLTHSLRLLGVPNNLAMEAVEMAVFAGRRHNPSSDFTQGLLHQTRQAYASRTLLDLFIPLLWIARKVDLSRREKVEQAAFEIVTGRLLL